MGPRGPEAPRSPPAPGGAARSSGPQHPALRHVHHRLRPPAVESDRGAAPGPPPGEDRAAARAGRARPASGPPPPPAPARASARTTVSRFHPARKPSDACWSAQPPQVPKCRQGGATRSGEGARTSAGASTSPPRPARAPAPPAGCSGMRSSPASPSPCSPRRSTTISTGSATRVPPRRNRSFPIRRIAGRDPPHYVRVVNERRSRPHGHPHRARNPRSGMSTSRSPTSTARSASTPACSASRSCSATATRRPSCPPAATTTTSASTPGRAGRHARRRRGHTGLYHTAILYPDRAALADALRRLVEAGIALDGAADHGVSEAIYLRDPDGNGVELYRDRPPGRLAARRRGQAVKMVNAPLDLRALLAEAPARSALAEPDVEPPPGLRRRSAASDGRTRPCPRRSADRRAEHEALAVARDELQRARSASRPAGGAGATCQSSADPGGLSAQPHVQRRPRVASSGSVVRLHMRAAVGAGPEPDAGDHARHPSPSHRGSIAPAPPAAPARVERGCADRRAGGRRPARSAPR